MIAGCWPSILQLLADARGCLRGFRFAGLGKNQGKFVAAVTRRSINRAAAVCQRGAEALDGAAAGKMAILSLIFFRLVQIEKQNGETAAGAARALDFGFEHFDQAPVIGEAGERIGSSQLADLIEKLRVIEQRATENDDVAHHHHEMSESVGSVEVMLRLAHGDVAENVERRREKQRAIQIRADAAQAAGVIRSLLPR